MAPQRNTLSRLPRRRRGSAMVPVPASRLHLRQSDVPEAIRARVNRLGHGIRAPHQNRRHRESDGPKGTVDLASEQPPRHLRVGSNMPRGTGVSQPSKGKARRRPQNQLQASEISSRHRKGKACPRRVRGTTTPRFRKRRLPSGPHRVSSDGHDLGCSRRNAAKRGTVKSS